MKLRKPLFAVLFALVCTCVTVLSTSLTYADGPGNSDAAKMCQHDGYLNYTRADRTPFNNVGECVSYAAQGGPLLPKVNPRVVYSGSGYVGEGFTPGGRVDYVTTVCNKYHCSPPQSYSLIASSTGTFTIFLHRGPLGSLIVEVLLSVTDVASGITVEVSPF